MRKVIRVLAIVVAVGSLAVLVASFPVVGGYESKAVMAQRVEVDQAAADLFGDAGHTPIGSPQQLIIEDPKAFLPGEGEGGTRLVSENYLRENRIYPLQLQSVQAVAKYVRYCAIAAMIVSLIALALARPRKSNEGTLIAS